ARALQNDLQQSTIVHVSTQTVRNRLHEGGMRTWRLQVGVVCMPRRCMEVIQARGGHTHY
uniref:Transposase n=1 Tax=Denticeps clupeoides TaxID=299321 RepID=A0AAY4CKM1_9TELE